jgi:predicted Fe-Mo cluster-binding NifX family protein
MRVGVPAKGRTLRSAIEGRFGRSRFLVVVDPDSLAFEVIRNPGLRERETAGMQACRVLIDNRVDAVVARNIGHNSLVTLRGAGIRVYTVGGGTVLDAVEKLKRGELASAEGPTVGFQNGLDEVE